MMMHGPAIVEGYRGSVRATRPAIRGGLTPTPAGRPPRHIGPLIPPSFRTRQKWIMIRSETASGIATQCST